MKGFDHQRFQWGLNIGGQLSVVYISEKIVSLREPFIHNGIRLNFVCSPHSDLPNDIQGILENTEPSEPLRCFYLKDILPLLGDKLLEKIVAQMAKIRTDESVVLDINLYKRNQNFPKSIYKKAFDIEALFLRHGFRKHPRSDLGRPLAHAYGAEVVLAFEKISPEILAAQESTESKNRMLHQDMLRVANIRADAHIARYRWALDYIGVGDTVLDVACGMGYGSYIMKEALPVDNRVIGLDIDPIAIDYARSHYGRKGLSFDCTSAEELEKIPDGSYNQVVSFETLEHLKDPVAFIRQCHRILAPGGRFIASVPHNWTNEQGIDPNPHHFHVYDLPKLKAQISTCFDIEDIYIEAAGGGMPRYQGLSPSICPYDDSIPKEEIEWLLIVGYKSPMGKATTALSPNFLRALSAPGLVHGAFQQYYQNPWIPYGLVYRGWRTRSPELQKKYFDIFLKDKKEDTADWGALLCAHCYRILQDKKSTAAAFEIALVQIDSYAQLSHQNPHILRWQISLAFVGGMIAFRLDDLELAKKHFATCAHLPVLDFSACLGTKTTEAYFWLGWISLLQNNREQARQIWVEGASHAEKVVKGDWNEVWGSVSDAHLSAIAEIAQVVMIAKRCLRGVKLLDCCRIRAKDIYTAIFEQEYPVPSIGAPDFHMYSFHTPRTKLIKLFRRVIKFIRGKKD